MCVIIAFSNTTLFALSTLGVVIMTSVSQVCNEPLMQYMLVVGFVSIASGAFFFYLAGVSFASDMEWALNGSFAAFMNLGQIGTLVWGCFVLWSADEQCREAANDAVNITFACSVGFLLILVTQFATVYLTFLPSFALQLHGLRKFK